MNTNLNQYSIGIVAGVVLLVGVAVFVERQRERIIAKAREWREELEAWE